MKSNSVLLDHSVFLSSIKKLNKTNAKEINKDGEDNSLLKNVLYFNFSKIDEEEENNKQFEKEKIPKKNNLPFSIADIIKKRKEKVATNTTNKKTILTPYMKKTIENSINKKRLSMVDSNKKSILVKQSFISLKNLDEDIHATEENNKEKQKEKQMKPPIKCKIDSSKYVSSFQNKENKESKENNKELTIKIKDEEVSSTLPSANSDSKFRKVKNSFIIHHNNLNQLNSFQGGILSRFFNSSDPKIKTSSSNIKNSSNNSTSSISKGKYSSVNNNIEKKEPKMKKDLKKKNKNNISCNRFNKSLFRKNSNKKKSDFTVFRKKRSSKIRLTNSSGETGEISSSNNIKETTTDFFHNIYSRTLVRLNELEKKDDSNSKNENRNIKEEIKMESQEKRTANKREVEEKKEIGKEIKNENFNNELNDNKQEKEESSKEFILKPAKIKEDKLAHSQSQLQDYAQAKKNYILKKNDEDIIFNKKAVNNTLNLFEKKPDNFQTTNTSSITKYSTQNSQNRHQEAKEKKPLEVKLKVATVLEDNSLTQPQLQPQSTKIAAEVNKAIETIQVANSFLKKQSEPKKLAVNDGRKIRSSLDKSIRLSQLSDSSQLRELTKIGSKALFPEIQNSFNTIENNKEKEIKKINGLEINSVVKKELNTSKDKKDSKIIQKSKGKEKEYATNATETVVSSSNTTLCNPKIQEISSFSPGKFKVSEDYNNKNGLFWLSSPIEQNDINLINKFKKDSIKDNYFKKNNTMNEKSSQKKCFNSLNTIEKENANNTQKLSKCEKINYDFLLPMNTINEGVEIKGIEEISYYNYLREKEKHNRNREKEKEKDKEKEKSHTTSKSNKEKLKKKKSNRIKKSKSNNNIPEKTKEEMEMIKLKETFNMSYNKTLSSIGTCSTANTLGLSNSGMSANMSKNSIFQFKSSNLNKNNSIYSFTENKENDSFNKKEKDSKAMLSLKTKLQEIKHKNPVGKN